MKHVPLIVFFLLVVLIGQSLADETEDKIKAQEKENRLLELRLEEKKKKKEIETVQKDRGVPSDLNSFGLGIGFGALTLLHDKDITSVVPDNNVIRITGEERTKLGLWLTASWINDLWPTEFVGFGPFFGVQLGNDEKIVHSLAVGFDLSFKRILPKLPLDLQLGYAWTKIDELARGYKEGQPLPEGSSQVLTRKVTSPGVVLIFSYKL